MRTIFCCKTIANTIPLNDYNPTWDYFWNQVAAEIPDRLPKRCRECYMSAVFLAQLTWGFLCITFGRVQWASDTSLLCVSNDNRDSSWKSAPSPTLCYSITHAHRSIGYHNLNPESLTESTERLMYLRVYDSRDSSRQTAPSPSVCYSFTHPL